MNGTGLDPSKRIAPAALNELIADGATVFLEQGAGEPLALAQALTHELRRDIRLLAAPIAGLNDARFGTANVARLNPVVFLPVPQLAEPLSRGAVSYVPLHWSDVIRALRERFVPDVALIQVSPPDEDGCCHLGGNAAFEREVARRARTVVAEVNPNVPRVRGDTVLQLSDIDHFVETDAPLRAMPPSQWSDADAAIAMHVAALVPAGATLQIGTGRIPDAVIGELRRQGKDIAIHSGILTDAMLALAMEQRGRHAGADIVAGLLLGTEALYRAVDRSPRVLLRDTDHTHSVEVMRGIDGLVSVNSAIEVDLLGQVNAEWADGRQVSGVGGQTDFFRGARASAGGRSIVALPSSTAKRSRIVATLGTGAPVSTSRVDVDCVVTEYGVAELRHRTEGERAEALIRIAHPDHREALRREFAQRDRRAARDS